MVYAVFGGSRQSVVGAASAIAVMSASIVATYAPDDAGRFIELTMALALLSGAIVVAAGLLRLGRIALFFSESVLVGLISGLALVIAVKQVPKRLGPFSGWLLRFL